MIGWSKRFGVRGALALGCGLLSMACGGTPLETYIEDHGFAPLKVPRAKAGAGTLVRFRDGVEYIVDPADGGLCLGAAIESGALDVQRHEARLEKRKYTVDRESRIELALGKALHADLDLGAAFDDARVKTVQIEFSAPFEEYVPESFVDRYVGDLEQGSQCHTYLTKDEGVLIIHMALGANGLTYTFLDEQSRAITLDAAFMDLVKADGELKSKAEGETTLEIAGETVFGVKLYQLERRSGAAEAVLGVRALSPDEARRAVGSP